MVALIAFSIFLVVCIVTFLVGNAMSQRTAAARLLKQRLEAVDRAAERRQSPELDLLRDELLSEIPSLHRFLSRSGSGQRLQKFLSQARVKMRPGAFILLMFGSAALGLLLGTLYTRQPMWGFLFGIAGGALPLGYASYLRNRRFRRFEEKFPEAIDLLSRSIRAGHAFSTALETIAEELEEPVSGEFRELFEEQKFGLPLRDALLNFCDRVPSLDTKFFGTAVMLQKETGGNLAEILDKLSYVIRERFKILRQLKVFTAQGRLTLMILMALPPTVILVLSLINRNYVDPLFNDPLGHILLFIGITLQTTGFFLIRKIIDIKV